MTPVVTAAPIVEGGNAAAYAADNPFMARCHPHVNPQGEETVTVCWEITRFPLAGLVFLKSSIESECRLKGRGSPGCHPRPGPSRTSHPRLGPRRRGHKVGHSADQGRRGPYADVVPIRLAPQSFVARRQAWGAGWRVMFHSATVYHERNEHDRMRDFAGEVRGYLHNDGIRKTLEDLHVASGAGALCDNLLKVYDALTQLGLVSEGERPLVSAWIDDLTATP